MRGSDYRPAPRLERQLRLLEHLRHLQPVLPGGSFHVAQFPLNHQDQEGVDHHHPAVLPLHLLHAQCLPFLLQKHLRPILPHGLCWTHGWCLVRERTVLDQVVGQAAEAGEGTGDQHDVDVQRCGSAPLQYCIPSLLPHHLCQVLG